MLYICGRKTNIMELEFRKKDGTFLFGLTGEMAQRGEKWLHTVPELQSKILTRQEKKYRGFECLRTCGYRLCGVIEFVLNEGDYIKIV